jgi:hypothetical protein
MGLVERRHDIVLGGTSTLSRRGWPDMLHGAAGPKESGSGTLRSSSNQQGLLYWVRDGYRAADALICLGRWLHRVPT